MHQVQIHQLKILKNPKRLHTIVRIINAWPVFATIKDNFCFGKIITKPVTQTRLWRKFKLERRNVVTVSPHTEYTHLEGEDDAEEQRSNESEDEIHIFEEATSGHFERQNY